MQVCTPVYLCTCARGLGVMLTEVSLAPQISASLMAWASSVPPAELGGSLFVLSLGLH